MIKTNIPTKIKTCTYLLFGLIAAAVASSTNDT